MNRRTIIATILILALAGGVAFAMWQNDSEDNDLNNDDQIETIGDDFIGGDDRETSGSTESGTRVEDDVASQDEEEVNNEEPGSGISSDSGVIEVFNPQENSVLQNGSKISGRSETSEVQYRIIDFERGVLTQGQLSVVDGRFSGTIGHISPSGNSGRVDVFSFNPSTGAEENIVEIGIRF